MAAYIIRLRKTIGIKRSFSEIKHKHSDPLEMNLEERELLLIQGCMDMDAITTTVTCLIMVLERALMITWPFKIPKLLKTKWMRRNSYSEMIWQVNIMKIISSFGHQNIQGRLSRIHHLVNQFNKILE